MGLFSFGLLGETPALPMPTLRAAALFLGAAAAVPASQRPLAAPAAAPSPPTTLFHHGLGGFPCIRTPALTATHSHVVAVAECRNCTGDNCYPAGAPTTSVPGLTTICTRSRPLEGGEWSPLAFVPTDGSGYNLRVVFDPKAARLVLHYTWGGTRKGQPEGKNFQVTTSGLAPLPSNSLPSDSPP